PRARLACVGPGCGRGADGQGALPGIDLGEELPADARQQGQRAEEQQADQRQHVTPVIERPAQGPLVAARQAIEQTVEALLEANEDVRPLFLEGWRMKDEG